jgi:hypothetical protein
MFILYFSVVLIVQLQFIIIILSLVVIFLGNDSYIDFITAIILFTCRPSYDLNVELERYDKGKRILCGTTEYTSRNE